MGVARAAGRTARSLVVRLRLISERARWLRLAVPLVAVATGVGILLINCFSGASPAAQGAAHTSAASVQVAAASARCADARRSGLMEIDVTSAGYIYHVPVYFPRAYGHHLPLPMVLDLHGTGGSGRQQLRLSAVEPTAAKYGFLVVAPTGGVRRGGTADPASASWNVPGVPLLNNRGVPSGSRDDIRFLTDTIDQLTSTLCVDPARVYAMGFSGGARMASALACADAGQLAGVAAISGLRAGIAAPDLRQPIPGSCRPDRPVPVLAVHGTADKFNPFDGGGGRRWGYSVLTAFQTWATLDGCTAPATQEQVSPHVMAIKYMHCTDGSDVQLYRVNGGGHAWPISSYRLVGSSNGVTNELDADELAWQFFSAKRT